MLYFQYKTLSCSRFAVGPVFWARPRGKVEIFFMNFKYFSICFFSKCQKLYFSMVFPVVCQWFRGDYIRQGVSDSSTLHLSRWYNLLNRLLILATSTDVQSTKDTQQVLGIFLNWIDPKLFTKRILYQIPKILFCQNFAADWAFGWFPNAPGMAG